MLPLLLAFATLAPLLPTQAAAIEDILVDNPDTPVDPSVDRMGISVKDLEPDIGTRSMVSMVLNGRRPLTVKMIRNLHEGLRIPLPLLLGSSS